MQKNLNFLDFEDAVTMSLSLASKEQNIQIISVFDALGYVLAKDIRCVKNLPSFNNSAMDGFAIKFEDAGKTLKINNTIFAGDKTDEIQTHLNENECYKIMTGAKVPSDADTIIPIENCIDVNDEFVTIPSEIKKGANLRLKGEEQKKGNILLKKGEEISSSHIALLASQGLMTIEVYKPLSIAVVSTGNEIKEPWEKAQEDEIYNCNSLALISQLKEKHFKPTYCEVIPDNLEKSIDFIKNLKDYDVIITSGGISMGDADFIEEAFLQNDLIPAFHGVNIKPGRPIMMGKMGKSLVISLPGNPLTAMVNMYLFVIPMLRKYQGNETFNYDISIATNQKDFKTKKGRVNIVLGKVENAEFFVTQDNKYGSGMVSALYESNAILVTHEDTQSINVKQEVKLIEFNSKFTNKKINILN